MAQTNHLFMQMMRKLNESFRMKRNLFVKYLKFIILIWTISGCARSNYFLNAFNGTSNYYHALPLQSDSIGGRNYFSSIVAIGGGNYLFDKSKYFTINFHRSYRFGRFQGYYGGDVAIGNYRVGREYL